VQNLEEKERKLHQTRSNFRTDNSDLDGKHLPERCSNSVPPRRTYNYRNAVPAPKCVPAPLHHCLLSLRPRIGDSSAIPKKAALPLEQDTSTQNTPDAGRTTVTSQAACVQICEYGLPATTHACPRRHSCVATGLWVIIVMSLGCHVPHIGHMQRRNCRGVGGGVRPSPGKW